MITIRDDKNHRALAIDLQPNGFVHIVPYKIMAEYGWQTDGGFYVGADELRAELGI